MPQNDKSGKEGKANSKKLTRWVTKAGSLENQKNLNNVIFLRLSKNISF